MQDFLFHNISEVIQTSVSMKSWVNWKLGVEVNGYLIAEFESGIMK
jgi:hypothetical protein